MDLTSSARGRVYALEHVLRQQTPEQLRDALGQIETTHFFADGMYARVLKRKAGVTIVGKVHKREHLYIVTRGRVAVTNGDGEAVIYEAGQVVVSKPGTKRAVHALEDSICMTVHRTDKTDLDEIEAELIELDPLAMLDARNETRKLA